MRGKKYPQTFFFSPPSYECFSGAYNRDVLLTKHRLQLLFPAFRLRDPKLDYVLLMRASWKKAWHSL